MHPISPLHQGGPGLRVDVHEPTRIAGFGELDEAAALRVLSAAAAR